ncbi:hypothetical protein FPV67DRAFT_1671333 [Lyophyllum atratum]|nr:hypothetical protein FPV67DRAFT_1671333 [Lyophyllum atratum]
MEVQTHSESFPLFDDAKDSDNNVSFASMCDSLQQEFLEILRIYYGYIPPSPYPTYMPPIADESEAKLVLKSFGESPTRTLMFYKHRPVLQLAHQFLEQLIKRGVPPPITCDFNDESPAARSLATSHRLHTTNTRRRSLEVEFEHPWHRSPHSLSKRVGHALSSSLFPSWWQRLVVVLYKRLVLEEPQRKLPNSVVVTEPGAQDSRKLN